MQNKKLEDEIRSLDPWYQKLTLDGILTSIKGTQYSGMEESVKIWEKINTLIPNFKNKKIIDIGCNAGYYSIRSAQYGAKVIGIEFDDNFYKQALFLKNYFEEKNNQQLDITYINDDISSIDFKAIGKVDYIFAFSILYHIGKFKYGKGTEKQIEEQNRMIEKMTEISDNFLVRVRKEENKNVDFYSNIFRSYGYTQTAFIPEGKRAFVMYSKE